jgi:splicing factor 3B subunit 3
MYLYSLSCQKPGAIQTALYGNFSDAKAQEIVLSLGRILELIRILDSHKKNHATNLNIANSIEVFGQIRSIEQFRSPGSITDQLIIGSDSGRIVILCWNRERNTWRKIHQETYGKTGCRRIVPGQYIAVEPWGRACMIASMEKNKLVYVLNRDTSGNLTISSPQEANKNKMLCFGIAALDVGLENPCFAALELDYSDVDDDSTGEAAIKAQKSLTIYELDLSINTCARNMTVQVDNGSNVVIAVPGGSDGPGGILICSENYVYYRSAKLSNELKVIIPRRFKY